MARPKKLHLVVEEATIEPGVQTVADIKAPSATITFTGDPSGAKDPAVAEYGGKLFPKGEAVTVDDENWLAINRAILKNNHFKVS